MREQVAWASSLPERLRPLPLGIEIPGYLRSPLAGASMEVPDGTAAGSPGFQSRAAEATYAPRIAAINPRVCSIISAALSP
jgi:hypothetical protein